MWRLLTPGLFGLLIALAHQAGSFGFVERFLHDARFGLTSRAASGQVVVVAIDPQSLAWLDTWPWPRRYYARVLERLADAGATRIALDVDFSSASSPEDDRQLAATIASLGPERVALPVFRQLTRAVDGTVRSVDTAPLPMLARGAHLVHADFRPDVDGLVRGLVTRHRRNGIEVPALSVWFLDDLARPPEHFGIDFSVDAASIPTLSFADVLEGTFDPALVRGKRVIIGATANELGDVASVPCYRLLPGAMIHALAFETLARGRAIRIVDGPPVTVAAALLTATAGPVLVRLSLTYLLSTLIGLCGTIVLATSLLQPLAGISVAASPLLFGIFGCASAAVLRQIRRKDLLLRRIVDNSFDAIITFDRSLCALSCNRAAELMFACPEAEVRGTALSWLLPGLTIEPTCKPADQRPQERLLHRSDGETLPVEVAFSATVLDGQWIGVAALRDITERKAQQAELERLARQDPLTGLANRTRLGERMAQAIAEARQRGERLALLLLDLDRFKEINDTLGHHVGDEVLARIGPRLRPCLADDHELARLGGDEFAILVPAISGPDAACLVAERMAEALRQPFRVQGLQLEVGSSIGIAIYPEHGEEATELLQRADVAMYAAKRQRQGLALYDPEADTNSVRRLTLRGELRRAIERRQLELHYQPKIAARSGLLAGVEVLVRWRHPRHGLIWPDEFVPFAEQTGLVGPMTDLLLDQALRQQRAWRRDGFDVEIALNLSVQSLQDHALPGRLLARLDQHGASALRLKLEITESALMADPERPLEVMAALATMGCRLSLDDFGTGYSSLAYLQTLPIHELKIDRSFVAAMADDPAAETIVRATVGLAHSLGLSVVAEGVEDARTLAALQVLGCDQLQGYHFAGAMPDEEFRRWLMTSSWSPAPDAQAIGRLADAAPSSA